MSTVIMDSMGRTKMNPGKTLLKNHIKHAEIHNKHSPSAHSNREENQCWKEYQTVKCDEYKREIPSHLPIAIKRKRSYSRSNSPEIKSGRISQSPKRISNVKYLELMRLKSMEEKREIHKNVKQKLEEQIAKDREENKTSGFSWSSLLNNSVTDKWGHDGYFQVIEEEKTKPKKRKSYQQHPLFRSSKSPDEIRCLNNDNEEAMPASCEKWGHDLYFKQLAFDKKQGKIKKENTDRVSSYSREKKHYSRSKDSRRRRRRKNRRRRKKRHHTTSSSSTKSSTSESSYERRKKRKHSKKRLEKRNPLFRSSKSPENKGLSRNNSCNDNSETVSKWGHDLYFKLEARDAKSSQNRKLATDKHKSMSCMNNSELNVPKNRKISSAIDASAFHKNRAKSCTSKNRGKHRKYISDSSDSTVSSSSSSSSESSDSDTDSSTSSNSDRKRRKKRSRRHGSKRKY